MTIVLVGTKHTFEWAWDEINYSLHVLTTGGAEYLERQVEDPDSATVSVVRIPVDLFELGAKIVQAMA